MISSRLNSHLSHFQVRTSEKGLISFSNEVKEKVGLAKVARREERERKQKEKRELEELVRLAKDILVEDHKKQTEQAKLEKLAEKELKMVKFSNPLFINPSAYGQIIRRKTELPGNPGSIPTYIELVQILPLLAYNCKRKMVRFRVGHGLVNDFKYK